MAEIDMNAAAAGEPEVAPSSGKKKKTLIMGGAFLGIMLIEGLAVFFLVRAFSDGPADAMAGANGLDGGEGVQQVNEVEVEVARFRAQNDRAQRMTVYDFTVFALVTEGQKKAFEKLQGARKNTIQDRFSSVIRASDPQRFLEPDLSTLRDKFKQILTEIMADEKMEIRGVLIPEIVSFTDG